MHLYVGVASFRPVPMTTRPAKLALFASYQVTVLLGVLFMPAALAASRLGVPVPFDRLLSALHERVE